MKGEEFKKYLYAELEEMKEYVDAHPELDREVASREWVDKYAADFRKRYDESKKN